MLLIARVKDPRAVGSRKSLGSKFPQHCGQKGKMFSVLPVQFEMVSMGSEKHIYIQISPSLSLNIYMHSTR